MIFASRISYPDLSVRYFSGNGQSASQPLLFEIGLNLAKSLGLQGLILSFVIYKIQNFKSFQWLQGTLQQSTFQIKTIVCNFCIEISFEWSQNHFHSIFLVRKSYITVYDYIKLYSSSKKGILHFSHLHFMNDKMKGLFLPRIQVRGKGQGIFESFVLAMLTTYLESS